MAHPALKRARMKMLKARHGPSWWWFYYRLNIWVPYAALFLVLGLLIGAAIWAF